MTNFYDITAVIIILLLVYYLKKDSLPSFSFDEIYIAFILAFIAAVIVGYLIT